jgi:uncharacterized membrane protein YhaH (DUF805 family)
MFRTASRSPSGASAMDYQWFLFGFEGRINRAKYWVSGLIIIGAALSVSMLLFAVAFLFGASKPLSFAFHGSDVFRIVDPTAWRLAIDNLGRADLTSAATLLPLLFCRNRLPEGDKRA